MRTFEAAAAVVVMLGPGLPAAGPGPTEPAAAAPTAQGLALHYSFNGDWGTTARDSSVNRINGAYVGTTAAAARSSGPPGWSYAAQLVGTSQQYVSVPERNALDVDRFTLAAWFSYSGDENPQTGGRWEILEKANAYWVNVRTDGRIRVGGFFGGCLNRNWQYLDSTVVVATDTWTHVAATFDGSTLRLWVNGERAGSRAVAGAHTCVNNRALAVGAKHDPDKGVLEAFWDGGLDEVRIYGRVLSGTEIRGLVR